MPNDNEEVQVEVQEEETYEEQPQEDVDELKKKIATLEAQKN